MDPEIIYLKASPAHARSRMPDFLRQFVTPKTPLTPKPRRYAKSRVIGPLTDDRYIVDRYEERSHVARVLDGQDLAPPKSGTDGRPYLDGEGMRGAK
jgi:hypothetical protein